MSMKSNIFSLFLWHFFNFCASFPQVFKQNPPSELVIFFRSFYRMTFLSVLEMSRMKMSEWWKLLFVWNVSKKINVKLSVFVLFYFRDSNFSEFYTNDKLKNRMMKFVFFFISPPPPLLIFKKKRSGVKKAIKFLGESQIHHSQCMKTKTWWNETKENCQKKLFVWDV